MSTIVPRWEWRTFGPVSGTADEVLSVPDAEPDLVADSDEVYLVSPQTEAAVKIRAGLMDVKVLEHVDEAGLEQWRPALKEAFPLPPGEAVKVCAALGVSAPPPDADALSSDEFLAVLAAPDRGVLAVRVQKHRRHYTIGGCMVEVTDVTAGGRQMRTLAVEATDAAQVVATVRGLGLFGRPEHKLPEVAQGRRRDAGLRWSHDGIRGHRRRHELGQVPHRRAARRRYVEHARRPREGEPPRRGHRRDG